jgi:hypothetical protein
MSASKSMCSARAIVHLSACTMLADMAVLDTDGVLF